MIDSQTYRECYLQQRGGGKHTMLCNVLLKLLDFAKHTICLSNVFIIIGFPS